MRDWKNGLNGDWQANSEVAKMYVHTMNTKYKNVISIEFKKVKEIAKNTNC